MTALVLAVLAVTPVSLSIELPSSSRDAMGDALAVVISEKLEAAGLVVEQGAPLHLVVDEVGEVFELSASLNEHRLTDQPARTVALPEVADRLIALALQLKTEADAMVEPTVVTRGPHLGAGVRVGALARLAPTVAPTLAFTGAAEGYLFEPVFLVGVQTFFTPGVVTWEVPVMGGVRLPIDLGTWWLAPEVLLGARFGFQPGFSAAFVGSAGLNLLRKFGSLRVGARIGAEFAPLGFTVQLVIER